MEGRQGKNQEVYVPPTDEERRREAVFALFDAVETGTQLPPSARGYLHRNPKVWQAALNELAARYPGDKQVQYYISRMSAEAQAS